MERYDDPLAHFDAWFAEARASERLPEAASLATVDAEGRPANRMVLVRWRTGPGFDVYTDLSSRKGEHLSESPVAALCWHWPAAQRQVRVEGAVEFLDGAAGDAYWNGRPREAQLAALTSMQSHPLETSAALDARYAEMEAAHTPDLAVPRPERWGGLRVMPERIEFWEQREHRLHDRLEYRLGEGGWTAQLLQP